MGEWRDEELASLAEVKLRRPRIASRCRRCASSCAWLGSGSGSGPGLTLTLTTQVTLNLQRLLACLKLAPLTLLPSTLAKRLGVGEGGGVHWGWGWEWGLGSSLVTRLDKVVQHADGGEVVGRRLGRAELRREECRRAVPARGKQGGSAPSGVRPGARRVRWLRRRGGRGDATAVLSDGRDGRGHRRGRVEKVVVAAAEAAG